MTDGCGLANANFFKALHEKFRWDAAPTAVQVRVNGAKVSSDTKMISAQIDNFILRRDYSHCTLTIPLLRMIANQWS